MQSQELGHLLGSRAGDKGFKFVPGLEDRTRIIPPI